MGGKMDEGHVSLYASPHSSPGNAKVRRTSGSMEQLISYDSINALWSPVN